jgi:hypothetical protein
MVNPIKSLELEFDKDAKYSDDDDDDYDDRGFGMEDSMMKS